MKSLYEINWWLVGVGILAILVLFLTLIGILFTPNERPLVYGTYEEDFEISHMEISGKYFIISARNDKDSFSVAVDSTTYAKYIVNDIIHVGVTIYEDDGRYYRGYEIMGEENIHELRR